VVFLAVAVLVVAVHAVTAISVWTGVGLLADDHAMVGCAVLRHRGDLTLGHAFFPPPAGDAPVALYRPFLDVSFWLEQPWFGIEPLGYHVTNSVLHCATALSWFVLMQRWSGSAAAGAATAVLFVGWPGHTEATHWIAARVNLLSTFLFSLALLVHDAALRRAGATRWAGLLVAGLVSVVAIGSKESAVLVIPVAAAAAFVSANARSLPIGRRLRSTAATMLPMVLLALAWCAWRAHCLGTWGTGTSYGWKASRIDGSVAWSWLELLLAPAHRAYAPTWAQVGIGVVHATLLLSMLVTSRSASWRWAVLPPAMLLLCGYLGGLGLERIDFEALENVRFTYEPALGLCALCGLGSLLLPPRWRLVVLTALVALHAFLLAANRSSWLRVSAVYARTKQEVLAMAQTSQAPFRVLDAPGVHDGAFGFMNSPTELYFWRETAPAGTNLRAMVTSTLEWPIATQELLAAAAPQQLPMPTFVVRWSDGALVPFQLDAQWPMSPRPGTTIHYARTARERPFVGSRVPVHVMLATDAALSLRAIAEFDGQRLVGTGTSVAPGGVQPVLVVAPLAATWPADRPVAISLQVDAGGGSQTLPLGSVVPCQR
jgi:hypothetical protein